MCVFFLKKGGIQVSSLSYLKDPMDTYIFYVTKIWSTWWLGYLEYPGVS